MKLLLIRHGATKANIERRFQGTIDYPLCNIGQEQARLLGKRLQDEKIFKVYTSYLDRAKKTSEVIASYIPECDIEVLDELKEYSWGVIEGLTREEIKEKYSRLSKEMEEDFWSTEIPGEEGMDLFSDRVKRLYDLIIRNNINLTAKKEVEAKVETIAVVCHGRVIGGFLAYLTGYDLYDLPWPFVFSNASLTEIKFFSYKGGIKPRIILLNDTCHIKGINNGITY